MTDWHRGVDDSIACVERRLAHYELYRTGEWVTTHPATFAILNELLTLLRAMRERGPR